MAEDDTPDDPAPPESLLPYDSWTEEALRLVVLRALAHAAAEGLPGGHHFYVTFRTTHPGVALPDRLREKYPEEMTIVLQHQFHDLIVDEAAQRFSVVLSFGSIPSKLDVPLDAVSAFVDPEVRFGLQFTPPATAESEQTPAPAPEAEQPVEPEPAKPEGPAEVVSLDAFRRKPQSNT